jgi:hypothetical protein
MWDVCGEGINPLATPDLGSGRESATLYETIVIREARNKRVQLPGRRASRCSF